MRRINSQDKRDLRSETYVRYDGRCFYCDTNTPLKKGTIDHYMPQALGGTNKRDNLRWACSDCNGKKADMHPDLWMASLVPVKPRQESERVKLLRMCAERMRNVASGSDQRG